MSRSNKKNISIDEQGLLIEGLQCLLQSQVAQQVPSLERDRTRGLIAKLSQRTLVLAADLPIPALSPALLDPLVWAVATTGEEPYISKRRAFPINRWLNLVSINILRKLRDQGWSDCSARPLFTPFLGQWDPDAADVIPRHALQCPFKSTTKPSAVMAWLTKHRPALHAQLLCDAAGIKIEAATPGWRWRDSDDRPSAMSHDNQALAALAAQRRFHLTFPDD